MIQILSVNFASILQRMSDGDKSFWGSIIGAAIGALGAFLVALVAILVDRKVRKKADERQSLRLYNSATMTAEGELNQLLSLLLKGDMLLNKCLKLERPGNFMMNLPRVMELNISLISNMWNPQLVDEWLTLSLRVNIAIQVVEDFNAYYAGVRDEVHRMKLEGNEPDHKVVIEDHQTLQEFAQSALNAVRDLLAQSIRVLALIQLHGEKGGSKDTKFKSPGELGKYVFKDEEIDRKAKELTEHYTPQKAFQDV
jgi:hypothetical protein